MTVSHVQQSDQHSAREQAEGAYTRAQKKSSIDQAPKHDYSEEEKFSNALRRPPSEPHLIARNPLNSRKTQL